MSLSGVGGLIQVNGAHFAIADGTKSLRSKTILLSNVNDGSAPTITADGMNVYSSANIKSGGFFLGNAKYLTSTTDVADGVYGGGGTNAAAITITNGRITSASNVSVASDLESVTVYGNTTTHKVSFNNADVSLSAAGNVEVLSGYVKAQYLEGDGSGLTNLVGGSPAQATHGSTGSVPVIQVGANGTIDSISNIDIAQTLQEVTDTASGNTTTNTVEFQNPGVSIAASGEVSAAKFTGDGGFLTNLSEFNASSGSFGSSSQVPVITFDNNGRISGMTTQEVRSNVTAGTAGKLAFYTSATQIESFSDLSKDGSNMTLEGTFTTEDMFVNGDLHVSGNTVVHDHVVIEDPILTIGNVSEATTQSVGTVFSRSDANVAMFYNKSSDGQAANKLTFGFTSNTGVGADIIIDSSRILESRFYGNVEATANITAVDTITAASFVGSGAQLTSIDFGAVDNNAETRLATAESDISRVNSNVISNYTTLDNKINSEVSSNIVVLQADVSNLQTSNGLVWSNIDSITAAVNNNGTILATLKGDHDNNVGRINTLSDSISGITYSSADSQTYIGNNFYVDQNDDVVSTVGSNLITSNIITGSGTSVGIGTSSPSSVLSVVGTNPYVTNPVEPGIHIGQAANGYAAIEIVGTDNKCLIDF